ncbi:MAG TPA: GSU2403 family nucleotidyltransferase fold protein, partial [Burkholderiales bacterium]|nr:GSU2403 family nucleotidyltransferase fold protein [Burkholderiales bacterium]
MIPFNDEQQRLLNNLTQYYEAWLGHARRLRVEFAYRLQWKTVAGREYLYKIVDRKGNGTSLGAKSTANEVEFSRYTAAREQVRAGERAAKSKLAVAGSLYRALRLPVIANPAAAILREADLRGMLDGTLLVIGTNAIAAYELEAGARFAAGLDATEDFDLSWSGDGADTLSLQGAAGHGVFDLLKAVDDTYTVNTERNFQARNRSAYSVELLSSPESANHLAPGEKLLPLSLPSQSWLLAGKPVSQVVCARDSTCARIVAPDPRVFALHKLWLSQQKSRERAKRSKDQAQGEVLLKAIAAHMPHYRLD